MTMGPIVGAGGDIRAYYASGNLAWSITVESGLQMFKDGVGGDTWLGLDYGLIINTGLDNLSAKAGSVSFDPASSGYSQNLLALENPSTTDGAIASVQSDGSYLITSTTGGGSVTGQIALRHTSGTNSAWSVGTGWQTPTFLGTFSSGSSASATYKGLRYKIDSDDNLVLFGAVHTTALAAGVHNIFTLPSGSVYIPQDNSNPGTFIHTRSNDALVADTTRINVNPTSGNVTIVNTAAFLAGDNLYINITVPLGNLS